MVQPAQCNPSGLHKRAAGRSSSEKDLWGRKEGRERGGRGGERKRYWKMLHWQLSRWRKRGCKPRSTGSILGIGGKRSLP